MKAVLRSGHNSGSELRGPSFQWQHCVLVTEQLLGNNEISLEASRILRLFEREREENLKKEILNFLLIGK